MRMIKYITLSQLIYWTETTSPFTFNEVQVDPAAQWTALNTTIKPFLDGSLDNPYSTTTPKEKLPQYFSTAAAIGVYLGEEYGDRLVSVPFKGGEFYPRLNRNLNKDEAMEIIMQELLSKATSFVSVYGYQFLKLFGTSSLSYDPRYSIQEHIRKVSDFGQHIVDNDYGARLRTDNLGNTQQTNAYGAQQLTDNMASQTDSHSSTQMNDLTYKAKTQDIHGGHTDTHSTTQHSDTITTTAVVNTSGEQAVKDTTTDKAHQNVETTDREATGVKTIQELLSMERQLLDWNPALEFFKAFTDKILLRAYYY